MKKNQMAFPVACLLAPRRIEQQAALRMNYLPIAKLRPSWRSRNSTTARVAPRAGAARAFMADRPRIYRIGRRGGRARGIAALAPWPDAAARAWQAAPVAMLLTTQAGRIVLANTAAADTFGYAPEALRGKLIDVLLPEVLPEVLPEGAPAPNDANLRACYGELTKASPVVCGSLRWARSDRSELTLHVRLAMVPTDGRSALVSVVVEQPATPSLAPPLFRVFESAPTALLVVDPSGEMRNVNRAAEALSGYGRDELIGRCVELLVPEYVRKQHAVDRKQFAQAPTYRRMGQYRDIFLLRKDGSQVPVEVALFPLEGPAGPLVMCDITDVTQRKAMEEQLRRRTDELTRSNRDLEQFAYTASHDLDEPLRAIIGMLGLVQRRYGAKLDDRANEFMSHAVRAAARMQALIDDLLIYSRIGTDKSCFELVDCNLSLDDALKNLHSMIQRTHATVSRTPLPTVRGVPTQLTRVFQNLLSNAIKYHKRGCAPSIQVGAISTDDSWVFSVADDGIGIKQENIEKIFGMFARLHSQTDYPGTGLGLFLCQKIIERHGGRIWLESTLGKGSTFFFSLPK